MLAPLRPHPKSAPSWAFASTWFDRSDIADRTIGLALIALLVFLWFTCLVALSIELSPAWKAHVSRRHRDIVGMQEVVGALLWAIFDAPTAVVGKPRRRRSLVQLGSVGEHSGADTSTEQVVALASGSTLSWAFATDAFASVGVSGLDADTPTLQSLRESLFRDHETSGAVLKAEVETSTIERVDLGIRDGRVIAAGVLELGGVALVGPGTEDTVRALLVALVAGSRNDAVEVLCATTLHDRLLPGAPSVSSLRRGAVGDIARTRRLDGADAPDICAYRTTNPENPLPILVVLLDAAPEESVGLWAALQDGAERLGIAVVHVGDDDAATGRIGIDATRSVAEAAPDGLEEQLLGAQLFGLKANEAVELLGVASQLEIEAEDTGPARTGERVPWEERASSAEESGLPTAATQTDQRAGAIDLTGEHELPWWYAMGRPLVVDVLGRYRITAHGDPVGTGLRNRGRDLLAYFVLHPEGATVEAAVDAIWRDTPPAQAARVFARALGDLRGAVRGSSGESLEVLVKIGKRYEVATTEMVCDLWEFQRALHDATRADTDDDARSALRRAADLYRGGLLPGSELDSIEAQRHDLHRRSIDAHLRLAQLEASVGRTGAAVAVLEQAISLDRYNEEPYGALMRVHAAQGRIEAVRSTFELLGERLGELQIDVTPGMARLYGVLSNSS